MFLVITFALIALLKLHFLFSLHLFLRAKGRLSVTIKILSLVGGGLPESRNSPDAGTHTVLAPR